MKKILVFALALFIFNCCERDDIVPESELPQWLVDRIESDEAQIEIDDKSMIAAGKWTRTKWEDMYYYEYENLLSSCTYTPISHDGDTLGMFDQTLLDDYSNNKCCARLVWEGPISIK